MNTGPRERRQQRAQLARRVLAHAAHVATALDWDTLDDGPAWLSLPEPALGELQCRLGALLCAPALRLWIDRPRVDAARAAVGTAVWQAVLARSGATDEACSPCNALALALARASAAHVEALLRGAGAAVLLGSMESNVLAPVAQALVAPVTGFAVEPQLACALMDRLAALLAQGTPS